MVDLTLVLVAIGLTFIEVCLIIFAFFIGSLCARAKRGEQMSSLTLLASLWATVEAKGLQRSTIIQRIIERHHAGAKMTEEQLDKLERDIADLAGEAQIEATKPRRKSHDEFMDEYPFDEEIAKDKGMSELV